MNSAVNLSQFKLNLGNILTFVRIFGTPIVVLLVIWNTQWGFFTSAFLFGTFCITDWLDGWVARKQHTTSEFGVYWDPLADKILIWGLFGALSVLFPWLILPSLLIIGRDILVTLLRNAKMRVGKPMKTRFLAKCKTALQMILGLTWLLVLASGVLQTIMIFLYLLTGAVVIITLWSGIDYLRNSNL